MTDLISRLAPASLRRAGRELIELPARRAYRAKLESISFARPSSLPVVGYGGVLSDGGLVHGGKVKLLALQEMFPDQAANFNLLYLVSSAPPKYAEDLVSWAKKHHVKLVWNQNGVSYPAWVGRDFEEINRPMRRLLQLSEFVVYQSEFCRDSADRFLGLPPCESRVLFNPVDTAMFSPAEPVLSRDTWRLLAAGSHMDASRVVCAIECADLLIKRGHVVELTVAGRFLWRGGDEFMRRLLAERGLENVVRLLPAFTQAEAVRLFQNSHVTLHLKYHDPCPTVVIESLACGVPVIGSRSGGLPEMTGDESVLIPVPLEWEHAHIPAADEVAMAVEKIMGDWETRSRAARERAVRLFDKVAWVERHREIFQKLIAQ